ncbi:MAG TPA: MFS transporter [Ktedonobacteraceae bacterium]|nr:MFS transporter [Ktedonobacteraceae bacterium]
MLRNRTLLAVSIAVCAAYIGIGMVVPVRVLYAESQGASLAIIGAMASAYLISNFLFQYPGGWLADQWGRKPMMLLSLLAQAVLSLVYLFITDPVLFVVLRFAEGIAAATFLPSARALIMDAVPGEKRGEAFGIFGAFFNVGFLFGPALGGLLAGLGYAISFIGAVIFRLAAVALVMVMIKSNMQRRAEHQQKSSVSLRQLFAVPLSGSYLLAFGDFLYIGFDITLVPLWMHDHLGASVEWIGVSYMLWSIPGIILAPIAGRIADRRRRSTMILIFGLTQTPLFILYGLSNWFWLVASLYVVHGVLYAFIQPAVDSHVASASAGHARARIQGLYSAFGLLGGFVGASGFSILYSWNFRYPLFAIGIGYGICVLIGGSMIRWAEHRNRLLYTPPEIYLEQEGNQPQTVLHVESAN